MKPIKIILIMLLCFSTVAHADFRKALDALQRGQGTEMLVEVEHAVKTKNNDGLSLFLGTLSDRLINDEFYTTFVVDESFYTKGNEKEGKLLLGKNNIPELMSLIEKAIPHNDKETLFDFALFKSKFNNKNNYVNPSDKELEKFSELGVVRAKYYLKSRNRNTGNKLSNLRSEFEIIKKSAAQGDIYSAARLAIIYLHWLPYEHQGDDIFFDAIPLNKEKGIFWLKHYASNTSRGDYSGACKLADEYYSGEKVNKNDKQAYLWYMHAAFSSPGLPDCTEEGLRKMAFTGDLKPLNEKLTTLIKNKDNQKLRTYLRDLNGKLEQPQDLTAFKTPINKNIIYAIKENRYSLEVYKNGVVKFEGFAFTVTPELRRRNNSFLVGRDEWTIPKKEVQRLSRELDAINVSSAPHYIFESVLCDTGEHWRHGLIKLNTTKANRSIGYSTVRHTFHTPILAKIFKIQESIIPTQHLRCGAPRKDKSYKNCVGSDAWNFKHAVESN